MPLSEEIRTRVLNYCERDLSDDDWFKAQFDFIVDQELQHRLALEYYSARYVHKLGEALAVSGSRRHAHVKFQIVQYASIYEAIIVHYLFKHFLAHPSVSKIQYHDAFKNSIASPSSLHMTSNDDDEVFFCVLRKEKTNAFSIKFDDKVNAAVEIGLVDQDVGNDIKRFYKLRNAIHLETALKQEIDYELADSQLAFERLGPFLATFRAGLARLTAQATLPAVIPNAPSTSTS